MLIDKNNIPMVAMEFMNDVHIEDVDIINELFELILDYEKDPSAKNKEKLNNKYKIWFEHTIEHFKGEEDKMLETNFPPYHFHKAEHDNALKIMEDIFLQWEKSGDIAILKQYFIEVLPTWIENHIRTMDTVTATYFKTGLSPCAIH